MKNNLVRDHPSLIQRVESAGVAKLGVLDESMEWGVLECGPFQLPHT